MASYEIIINGKKVRITIKREFSAMPYSEKLMQIARTRLPSIKDSVVAEMCRNFLRRDTDGFYGHCRKIVEGKILEVLKQHPEFITSKNFEIEIIYSSEISSTIAAYEENLSSEEKISLKFYLLSFFTDFLTHGESSFLNTVYHEFAHHLDRNFIKKIGRIRGRIVEVADKESTSPYSIYIIRVFEAIRNEAITTFFGEYRSKRAVTFRNKEAELSEMLQRLFGKDASIENLIESIENKGMKYHAGSEMAGIIILNSIIKEGKGNLVFIMPVGFRLFGRKEVSSSKINRYYGKSNFDLCFYNDSELDAVIYRTINEIKKLSHIGFIKKYEASCNELGVHPFISWELYRNCRKRLSEPYKNK